jgi:hypothetical protein
MKIIISSIAIALSASLIGCIQSAPVKPVTHAAAPPVVQPVKADRIVNSCLEYKRFVIKYYDTTGNLEYVTFSCQPIYSSKQPPRQNAVELAPTQ